MYIVYNIIDTTYMSARRGGAKIAVCPLPWALAVF